MEAVSEFKGIRLFVALDWFVSDFRSKIDRYVLYGDAQKIVAAYKAAFEGSSLLASIRSRIKPLLALGFELREEAVPTSVGDTWFNMRFLSFGLESKVFVNTLATNFVTDKLKQMELVPPELNFKLFYLAPMPAATTTEGHHVISLKGFTNIDKQRIELNIFPPRDYPEIFRHLVHETVHMCLLEKTKQEKAATVEPKVEAYTKCFFDRFSKEYALAEKPMLEDLRQTIDKHLPTFSKADAYLLGIFDSAKLQNVIQTLLALFDAVLDQSAELRPKS